MPHVRVGLTGGIGSGKSTVARAWVARGGALVDTDAIAHALTAAGGAALPAIVDCFGAGVLAADGRLDRAALREIVFADEARRLDLEAILHPMIGQEVERQAARALQAGATVLLFDVPLLAESGRWRERVDRVVVVDCPQPVQVERVVRRSGWTTQMVEAVIARQASRAQRRSIADAVVFNGAGTPLRSLEGAAATLHRRWAR